MLREMYYWMMYFTGKTGRTDMFEFNTYLLTSVPFVFYIMSIFLLFCHAFNIDYSSIVSNYKVCGIVLCTVVFVPLFFFLYKKRKTIVEKYDTLPPKRRIRGKIIFWIYTIVSLPLFYIIVLAKN
jgi:hypothetical protein